MRRSLLVRVKSGWHGWRAGILEVYPIRAVRVASPPQVPHECIRKQPCFLLSPPGLEQCLFVRGDEGLSLSLHPPHLFSRFDQLLLHLPHPVIPCRESLHLVLPVPLCSLQPHFQPPHLLLHLRHPRPHQPCHAHCCLLLRLLFPPHLLGACILPAAKRSPKALVQRSHHHRQRSVDEPIPSVGSLKGVVPCLQLPVAQLRFSQLLLQRHYLLLKHFELCTRMVELLFFVKVDGLLLRKLPLQTGTPRRLLQVLPVDLKEVILQFVVALTHNLLLSSSRPQIGDHQGLRIELLLENFNLRLIVQLHLLVLLAGGRSMGGSRSIGGTSRRARSGGEQRLRLLQLLRPLQQLQLEALSLLHCAPHVRELILCLSRALRQRLGLLFQVSILPLQPLTLHLQLQRTAELPAELRIYVRKPCDLLPQRILFLRIHAS
mmetsp:Transcript_23540/g.47517  ORF Transcript_23540/g.47517 Transcript_23540/m.47517 type:complete len:432 (+) Transcript_23540:247-1542(+)